jgi:hypothetical protein
MKGNWCEPDPANAEKPVPENSSFRSSAQPHDCVFSLPEYKSQNEKAKDVGGFFLWYKK